MATTIFSHLPITALHFLDDHWLTVGEGSRLSLFDIDSGSGVPAAQLQLQRDVCVHGIRSGERLGPDGARLLLVFGVRHLAVCAAGTSPAHLAPVGHICTLWDQVLDAVMLEEELFLITAHNRVLCGPWRAVLENQSWRVISCAEQCLLYSALFIRIGSALFAASGTVFNETLLWRPQKGAPGDVDHRLKAHKGVIFGIHFDAASERICSVSDDRTVAIWRGSPRAAPEKGWASFQFLGRFFAHEARVWAAHLLPWGLVSIGEDCRLNVWLTDGPPERPARKLHEFGPHRGRGVWSLAVQPQAGIVACGGNDGAIFLHRFGTGVPSGHEEDRKSLTVLSARQGDFPRNLFYGANESLYVFMDSGQILARKKNEMSFALFLDLAPEFSSYIALAVGSCRTRVVFGSLSGCVRMFRIDEDAGLCPLWERQFGHLKVMSAAVLDEEAFVSLADGSVIRLCVFSGVTVDNFLLPEAKKFRWMTAVVTSELWALVGDREGRLTTFRCESGDQVCSRPAHGRLGVTDLQWILQGRQAASAGRNGILRIWSLQETGSLQPLREIRHPGQLAWIDRILEGERTPSLCGFQANKMKVVDMNSGRVLLQLECGGGHRAWDISGPSASRAAFIAKGEVLEFSPELGTSGLDLQASASLYLKDSWHGREVNCCAVAVRASMLEIVVGSEDTAVSFCTLPLPNAGASFAKPSLHRFAFHISSVRCLTSAAVGGTEWLFSAGGRGMLVAWRRSAGASLMPVTSHFASGGPRRRDLDRADLRVMAVATFRPNDAGNSILLALACSDGSARILQFAHERFKPLHCLPISSGCLLSCLLSPLALLSSSPALCFLLTTSTDGFLRAHSLSSPSDEPSALLARRVTSSGALNCMAELLPCGLALCGADSGCVHLWRLPGGPGSTSRPAHAAAVTAVAWEDPSARLALSLGSDQRVRRWSVVESDSGPVLRPLGVVLLGVADPHDMAIVPCRPAGGLVVVGNGLEVLRLDPTEAGE